MAPAFVFGYGSLLEGVTGTPCRLAGWRRRFGVAMDNRRTIPGYKYFVDAATGERPEVCVAFLDLVPDGGGSVEGVVIEVDDLAALDARERNYRRVEVDLGGPVWVYVGREEARARYSAGPTVVSRAYLHDVRAGFAAHGLELDTVPDVPVLDLVRVDVPGGR